MLYFQMEALKLQYDDSIKKLQSDLLEQENIWTKKLNTETEAIGKQKIQNDDLQAQLNQFKLELEVNRKKNTSIFETFLH